MIEHPRLLFCQSDIAHLCERSTHPQLKAVRDSLIARADDMLTRPPLSIETGNACRHHQGRVLSLALAFLLTEKPEFLRGAVRELDWAAAQEDWKWNPTIEYSNLLTGEISMTFGLAYDWLYHHLSEAERTRFRDAAQEKGLQFYHDQTDEIEPRKHRVSLSNWNTVTNGGALVLALALEGESTLSRPIIEQAVRNMKHFWDYLGEDGGWCEGISYWRFGMRYAFLAAQALRRCGYNAEELGGVNAFEHPGAAQTGYFPILFQPGRTLEMSFADSSGRHRMPTLYLLGKEYSNPDFVWYEDREPLPSIEEEGWPMEVFALLWRPLDEDWLPEARLNFQPELPRVAAFPSIGWAMMASSQPDPEYSLAFKSGSLAVSHTHLDLNHISVAVGEEYLLVDLGRRPYTSDYFGDARFKYYELDTRGHNTVLIGGKGQRHRADGKLIGPLHSQNYDYFIGVSDGAYHAETTRARRHVVFVKRRFWILLDEIETPSPQSVELRFHTYAEITSNAEYSWTLQQNDAALDIIAPDAQIKTRIEEPDEWIKPIRVLSMKSATPVKSSAIITLLHPRRASETFAAEARIERDDATITVCFENERVEFERGEDGWRLVMDES